MNSKPNQDHEALHDRAPALERENIQLRKDWAGLRLWLENEKAEYESMRLYGSAEAIELVLSAMSEADGL